MRKHLRSNIQWELLLDYAQFGCRNRSATASHFGNLFLENPDQVQLRKYAALKVYEELVLATEDLCMLYFALRDRDDVPPLERLLTFNVDPKKSKVWHDELGGSDEIVLGRLGYLDGSGRLRGSWNDPQIQVKALLTAIDAMREAASDRVVADGVLVRALNKLKYGFIATSLGHYIEAPASPGQNVAILYLDRDLGRLNRFVVEATDQKVSEMNGYGRFACRRRAVLACVFHQGPPPKPLGWPASRQGLQNWQALTSAPVRCAASSASRRGWLVAGCNPFPSLQNEQSPRCSRAL